MNLLSESIALIVAACAVAALYMFLSSRDGGTGDIFILIISLILGWCGMSFLILSPVYMLLSRVHIGVSVDAVMACAAMVDVALLLFTHKELKCIFIR